MKKLLLALVVCGALAAEAKWSYSETAGQIVETTDAEGAVTNWVLGVTEKDGELTIASNVSGSGDLDLTSFSSDNPGKKVTSIKSGSDLWHGVFGSCSAITAFIAPDVTWIGQGAFFSCQSLTNVALSADMTGMQNHVFYSANAIRAFYPTRFEKLTSVGVRAFSGFGASALGADLEFPLLTSMPEGLFEASVGIRSVKAPEVTAISGRAFIKSSARDVYLPKAATIGSESFGNCSSLTNVVLSSALNALPGSAFASSPNLETIYPSSFTNLSSVGASVFSGCSSLTGPLTFDCAIAEISESAFKGCSSLLKVTFKSPVTTVGAYAFAGIAPSAHLEFFGDMPSFGSAAIYAKDGEKDIARAMVYVDNVKSRSDWMGAISPVDDTSRADYPGADTVGLLQCADTDEKNWVVNNRHDFRVSGEPREIGTPNPDYGYWFGVVSGTRLSGEAPAEQSISSTEKACFEGWRLVDVQTDGTETPLDSAGTNGYSFVTMANVHYTLYWQTFSRYLVDVTTGSLGSVDLTDPWVREGTQLTVVATPSAGCSFVRWSGDLPDGAVVDGNRITFTVTKAAAFSAQFERGWEYDPDTGVLSNGTAWVLSTSLHDGELTLTGVVSAESTALDLSRLEAQLGGYRVVAIQGGSAWDKGVFSGRDLTEFIGPDVVSLGYGAFSSCTALTNVVCSSALHTIAGHVFYNARRMMSFYPSVMTNLTTLGSSCFIATGADGTGSLSFDMPKLASADGVNVFEKSRIVRFAATNYTGGLVSRMFYGCSQLGELVMPLATSVCSGNGSGSCQSCGNLTNIDVRSVKSFGSYSFDGISPAAVMRFEDAAPTFDAMSVRSSSGAPVKICFTGRAGRRQSWLDLASPNAAVFESEYKTRADFPGTKDGYDTIGIVSTGTSDSPVYNWLIDTLRHRGLAVFVR